MNYNLNKIDNETTFRDVSNFNSSHYQSYLNRMDFLIKLIMA